MENKNKRKTYPLTSNQRDIWFDQAIHPDIPLYNIGGYLRIDGKIDPAYFKQAIVHVVKNNDALRTKLRDEKPVPVQEFCDEIEFECPFIDFSNEKNPFEKANEWLRTEFCKPFQFFDSLLFRFALVKVSEKCYCFLNCQHHLIVDGYGDSILINYIAEEYNALLAKERGSDPKPSYKDFIESNLEYLKSTRYKQSQQYWKEKYQDLPEPPISRYYANDFEKEKSPSSSSVLFIEMDIFERIEEFAKSLKSSAFHVIIAALYTYFARTSGEKRVVMGMPMLNRNSAAFKRTVGSFITVFPILLDFGVDNNLKELTQLILNEVKKDYRHQRFPLSEINKLCRANNKFDHIFDISISYEEYQFETYFNGSPIEAITMENGFESIGLSFSVKKYNRNLPVSISFCYNQTAFNEAEINLLKKRIKFLLLELIDKPNIPVKDIPLIPPAEKKLLLTDWNSTKRESGIEICAHKLFEKLAETHPDKTAIVSEERKATYKELNTLANRVASTLVHQGVGLAGLVGICSDRDIEMVAGIFGVMKTGNGYLPIDPAYPNDRIDYMIKDAGLKTIIVSKNYIDKFLSYNIKTISLEGFNRQRGAFNNINCKVKSGDVAYVIYTSGSTGKPKGVMVAHKGLRNLVNVLMDDFNVRPDSIVLQFASLSFDASVSEIIPAICSGATLCLVSQERIMPGPELIKTLKEFSITNLTIPPSSLSVVPYEELPCLKTVVVAGEACHRELAEKWSKNRLFINAYGPTESTVCATTFNYSPGKGKLPIGKPIENIHIHILDKELNLMPIGVPGDLYIGGVGLAAGYLNIQELTDEKFIPNPYIDISGPRLYKTGDIARYLPDGNIEFLGRDDFQVKVRGYRIELSEIETVLLKHPEIKHAVVVVSESEQNMKQMIGFIIKNQGMEVKLDRYKLLVYLKKSLPDYMVPLKIVFLEKYPLTPNGKVDRNKLSKESFHLSPETKNYIHTKPTETEKMLLEFWQKVCGKPKIGLNQDFVEFGVDSLQAVQFLAKIVSTFNINMSQSELFQRSTIKSLAFYLDNKKTKSKPKETKKNHTLETQIVIDKHYEVNVLNNANSDTQSTPEVDKTSLLFDSMIIPLSETDGKIAFYCVASGHGDLMRFTNLANKLKEECSFYMLQPPNLELLDDINFSINDLAEMYTKLILSRETKECRVGGFSIGGILALEVGRKLKENKINIKELILIDTVFPVQSKLGYILMVLLKRMVNLPGLKEIGLGSLKVNGRPLNLLFTDYGLLAQVKSLHLHKIKDFQGSANLIMSQTMTCFNDILFEKWNNCIKGKLTKHYISGFHGSIFKEAYINGLVDVVKRCL